MRIHHFTIPANDPELVAGMLAEVLGARVIPMPHPRGGLLVYAGDADGSAIEVWPAAMRAEVGHHHLEPRDLALPEAWPHHGYVTADTTSERILDAFSSRGWKADLVRNGPPNGPGFELVRGWLENQTCIEIGGTEMRAQYEDFVRMATAPRG